MAVLDWMNSPGGATGWPGQCPAAEVGPALPTLTHWTRMEFRLVSCRRPQDEVRSSPERLNCFPLKRTLCNDKLWGYDKKDCVLTINEEEARVVRRIFRPLRQPADGHSPHLPDAVRRGLHQPEGKRLQCVDHPAHPL